MTNEELKDAWWSTRIGDGVDGSRGQELAMDYVIKHKDKRIAELEALLRKVTPQ